MDLKTSNEIIARLEREYPIAECTLDYNEAYHLLVSVRLAAQCTDARVNMVTPALFEKYPTPYEMAEASVEDVEGFIKSTGFYHGKARDIVAAAQMLVRDFGGRVPDNMEDLLKLPGVGRKSANLILGDVYGVPGSVVVDTHCIRLTRRLGYHTLK
ncbi:MAG: endonuclease III, partial [Oscillospiraceae bacterium]|nr:endonuclease III [Oscillospiraceae bacterium]